MVRIELTFSCAQDTRATGAPHPDESIDPCGIRTRPGQLERLATSPEVERALSMDVPCLFSGTARNDCWRWAGRRSNPSLLVFSQALNRLSYQPMQFVIPPEAVVFTVCLRQNEKARCLLVHLLAGDTGLFESSRRLRADVTCAGDTGILRSANPYSPNYRQSDAGTGNARVALRKDSHRYLIYRWQTTSYRSDRIPASAVKAS